MGIILCVCCSMFFIFLVMFTNKQTLCQFIPEEERQCNRLKASDKKQKWNDHSPQIWLRMGERAWKWGRHCSHLSLLHLFSLDLSPWSRMYVTLYLLKIKDKTRSLLSNSHLGLWEKTPLPNDGGGVEPRWCGMFTWWNWSESLVYHKPYTMYQSQWE